MLTLALLWLPARLLATTADDLCASSADPCIVSTPITVQDPSVIDVGARELRIASGGVLDVGSGTMTLNAGTLTVQTGGFLRARGGMTPSGGTITINVVAGNIIVAPDPSPAPPTSPIDASGAPGGTINVNPNVTPTGDISVSGSIMARALSMDSNGGSVQISAHAVTVSAQISVLGGPATGVGGSLTIATSGDLTVNNVLQASGGDSGGTIEVSTGAGNLVVSNTGVLRADATAQAGIGGEIDFTASGDGSSTGLATINGLLSVVGFNGTTDSGGGDGGCICIEAAGDIHIDLASAKITADGGAPDADAGQIDFLSDNGGLTMQGALSASVAGPESGAGDVQIETATDTTIGGSILLTAGDSGGGTADLTSDSGSVSIAASGVIDVSGSSVAAGNGGTICLQSGSDSPAPHAVLVEGKLVADGGPGGGKGGVIDLEGGDSVRVASTGSLHASGGNSGGGNGGTLTANADSGITSIEGPMTAAGGGPTGSGGILSVEAAGRVSITAPLDASGFGIGNKIGIATTTGPVDVFSNITVASSTAAGGLIEIVGQGDIIVAGTLVSDGVVAPSDSAHGTIRILGCNVTLCGMDAQSCPAGSTGVLSSLGPSGVNRVTDRNSSAILGTMRADQGSGSNDLVYDGKAQHKPLVLGQVKPAPTLVLDATVMACPICGDHMTEPPETCDDGNTSDGDGCSSTCQLETPLPGDTNGDHVVSVDDIGFLIEEIFDGDGDSASMVSSAPPLSSPGVDANGDTLVSAADITATIKVLPPAP